MEPKTGTTGNVAGTTTPDKPKKTRGPRVERPEFTLEKVEDLSAQVERLRTSKADAIRNFTLGGFSTTACLDGIENRFLAVMRAAISRQMAINGPAKEVAILNKLDAEYSRNVGTEIEQERILDGFTQAAVVLGNPRLPTESASDFIARMKKLVTASTK